MRAPSAVPMMLAFQECRSYTGLLKWISRVQPRWVGGWVEEEKAGSNALLYCVVSWEKGVNESHRKPLSSTRPPTHPPYLHRWASQRS